MNPTPGRRFAGWLGTRGEHLILGAALVVLAMGVHFFCCDWRLPRREYSPTLHKYVTVPYDNQLIGVIHAGSLFRMAKDPEEAWYDLTAATWWGLYLPMMYLFVGTMAMVPACVPEARRQAIDRRLNAVFEWIPRRASAAACALILVVLSGTTVVGSVYVREVGTLTLVQNANDSYTASAGKAGDESRLFQLPSNPLKNESSSFSGTIPEPGSLVLLAAAAASAVVYGWRRRKRAAQRVGG